MRSLLFRLSRNEMPQAKAKQLSPEDYAEVRRRYVAMESAGVLYQASRSHYDSFLTLLAAKHKIPKKHAVLNLQTGEISRKGKR